MSKGGSAPTQTTTTDESKQAPAYVTAAQQNLISQGGNILSPFLNQPDYGIMGQNPDQQQAFDYARQMAVDAFPSTSAGGNGAPAYTAPGAYQGASYTAPGAYQSAAYSAPGPYQSPGPYASPGGAGMVDAATGKFTAGSAAQLGGDEYRQFLNPYTQDVVNTTLANMRRQNNDTHAQIGARSAASGAFGGSREAIMRGQQDRSFGEQSGSTVAQLMAQGYDKATAQAMQNAQMRQQTGMQNTSLQNAMSQFNAGQQNQVREYNAGANDRMNLADAQNRNQYGLSAAQMANQYDLNSSQQASQFNQNAAQQANQYGLATSQNANQFNQNAAQQANQYGLSAAQMANQYGLQAPGIQDSLANNAQARQLKALQQLLATGNQQQQFGQSAVDLPFTMLDRLKGITPQDTSYTGTSTKVAPDNSPSPLMQILGLGATVLPKVLSDEREKTDVKILGIDPKTGVEMAAYRYKGDPKEYPKVVGPASAQQVERVQPGSTENVSGRRVIKGGLLSALKGR
jgi:hypothetical protein